MSKYNWPELFTLFEESELTQTQFCKEHNINPKYFNLKYSQHRSNKKVETAFVKAELEMETPATTLSIQLGRCTVICPESMPIPSFVSLVHQLA